MASEEEIPPSQATAQTGDADVEVEAEAGDLTQAYRELAKGEQTAAQMEASLTVLESKLEAMLKALEGSEKK
ncbi:hypothetical protein E4U22_005359 [Claviceps purpurea]|nr:hypothetical protein E4U12_006423 [Claviceps purpurea]KAG6145396.1 hypothetical protein E4U38_007661 [Claviceps purpurea]KAG6147175.1 hypothetical protein E4U28_007498 [Claviceps purpurea]KAG6156491.1 hypothetical protein E4U37_000245 [Claviceps purpurea]KAG6165582.1 hypothetical protein E4U27_008384 [Claviceps purpurea]